MAKHWTAAISNNVKQNDDYDAFPPAVTIVRCRYSTKKRDELDHYETMMGVPRGRLAVTMDTITDAMALVGQHGVYCQSQRWPGSR